MIRPSKLDEFRVAGWVLRLNRAAQVVLTLVLLAGLNWVATRTFSRVDLTRDKAYSLSPETRGYLRSIPAGVEVFATVTGDGGEEGADLEPVRRYLRDLLAEYEHATRGQGERRVVVEHVDVFREVRRASELERRFGNAPSNAVVVASGPRHKVLLLTDLVELADGRPKAYRGEQAITAAILEVSDPRQPVVYFVTGHGEMRPDDVDPRRGLSQWSLALRQRNVLSGTIDLSQRPEIPEDAALVVIAAPTSPFLPEEVPALRRYLEERSGRVLLLVGPDARHGLDDLLYEWGLLVDEALVVDPDGLDLRSSGGDLILRQFADHPVTRLLLENQLPLVAGLCRPVRADPGAPLDTTRRVTPLLASSGTSWAERAFRQGGYRFDPELDLRGPVPVMSVSVDGAASSLGISLGGGRLLVAGCPDLLANQRFGALGNSLLGLQLVQWMVDAPAARLDIPPRPVDRFQLPLSRQDLLHLAGVFLVLPGAVGLLGLLVQAFRRR